MKKIRLFFRNIFKHKLVAESAALSLIAAVLISSFYVGFYNNLQNNIREHAENYLTENGSRAVNTLNEKVNSIFSTLTTLSSYVADQPAINSVEALNALHEQSLMNQYSTMLVIIPDGTCFSADTLSYNAKDRDYFLDAMKGKNAISNIITSRMNGEPSIVFAVPIYKDNKIIGVLSCVYQSEMFISLLNTSSFNGNGRILLIQNDGTAIIGSTRLQRGSNYFDTMKNAEYYNDSSFSNLIKKIRSGESGLIHYRYSDEYDYASFHPVRLNNWYVISIVSSTFIENQSKQISGYSLNMIFEIIVVFLLFIVYVILSERKNAKMLLDSNQKFEALADNIPGGVLRCGTDENITMDYVSDGCLRMLGCTRDHFKEQYQNKFANIIYEKDREKAMKNMDRQLKHGHHVSMEFRILDTDGKLHWVLHHGRVISDSDNKKRQYIVLTDNTKSKATQEELRQSFERYRIVMEQSDSVIYEYNLINDSAYVSENFKKMFGYELSQENFSVKLLEEKVVHPDDETSLHELYQKVKDGEPRSDIELRIRKIDGTYLWCRVQTTTVFDNFGVPVRALAKVTDISAEKAETEQLMAQAQHDPLTGVYNKAASQMLIEQYIKTAGQSTLSALFMLDMDHFKQANDSFGHLFGDSVLVEMAAKIKKLFRSTDVIGRVGGDEFVVFLKDISNEKAISEKAREICESMKKISLEGHSDYKVSCSVGIAVVPKDSEVYLDLFKKADEALYYSKNHGKDGYTFYNSEDMAAHHYSSNR